MRTGTAASIYAPARAWSPPDGERKAVRGSERVFVVEVGRVVNEQMARGARAETKTVHHAFFARAQEGGAAAQRDTIEEVGRLRPHDGAQPAVVDVGEIGFETGVAGKTARDPRDIL